MTSINKYLLLSAMQKAVRRGCIEEAKQAFDLAYVQDPFHTMYRVAISALEDGGAAIPSDVQDFLKTALRKKEIEAMGGQIYVQSIVEKLASGPKDRTACDASWIMLRLQVK